MSSSPGQQVCCILHKDGNMSYVRMQGTGKSVLLREIIKTLRDKLHRKIAITASTGIASVNIGGTTLHSWAGIGLGQEDAKKLAGKIIGNQKLEKVRERWREVRALILDEGAS